MIKRSGILIFLSWLLFACGQSERQAELLDELNTPIPMTLLPMEREALTDTCQRTIITAQLQVKTLEKFRGEPTVDNFLKPFDRLWLVLLNTRDDAHLYTDTHPNQTIRDAAQICKTNIEAIFTSIRLSPEIYRTLSAIDASGADPVTQRYLEKLIHDFERGGIDQNYFTRHKLKSLFTKERELGERFNRGGRGDMRYLTLQGEDELAGLPADFIEARRDENDEIVVSTDYDSYRPMMRYAISNVVRETLYQRFMQRGYPHNIDTLEALLATRYEIAQTLGYDDWASYAIEPTMAGSVETVLDFIDQVHPAIEARASAEYQILLQKEQQFNPLAESIKAWQVPYLRRVLQEELFNFDAEAVRQYFYFDSVKQGLFLIVADLFEIRIEPWDTPVWHESVSAHTVWRDEELIGYFYLDMHPRKDKYKHNQHLHVREGVEGVQLPASALVTNLPSGLMEYIEVRTFFHEFGHLLHQILGGQSAEWVRFSGISTERDFTEAPSRLFEKWIQDGDILRIFARDRRGEPISYDLLTRVQLANSFGRGIEHSDSIARAVLSLNLHQGDPANIDPQALMEWAYETYTVTGLSEDIYPHLSFGHLDRYSAVFYSYLWSQVIADDLFTVFTETGLLSPVSGHHYDEFVLAPGGSQPAAEMVDNFLGRSYEYDTFIDNQKRGTDIIS